MEVRNSTGGFALIPVAAWRIITDHCGFWIAKPLTQWWTTDVPYPSQVWPTGSKVPDIDSSHQKHLRLVSVRSSRRVRLYYLEKPLERTISACFTYLAHKRKPSGLVPLWSSQQLWFQFSLLVLQAQKSSYTWETSTADVDHLRSCGVSEHFGRRRMAGEHEHLVGLRQLGECLGS